MEQAENPQRVGTKFKKLNKMKTLNYNNPTTTIFNTIASIIILIFVACNAYGMHTFPGNGNGDVPGR